MSDIDDRVAKEVMGWGRLYRWSPSTDMNDAMQVVEKMRERGYWVDMTDWSKNWEASFYARGNNRKWTSSSCDTLPEAICKAALAAVEGGT